MPNGKPIASDQYILELFEQEFIVNGEPRDSRFVQETGLTNKHFYTILAKKRFNKWIEYGITLRSGWLTEEGKQELERLRKL